METRNNVREQLALLEADAALPQERRRVARILLAYADGLPTEAVALSNDISRSRARFWRKQFELHGMKVFDPNFSSESRKGKRRAASAQHTAPAIGEQTILQLRTLLSEHPDDETARRIRIILAYAEGRSTADIAAATGRSQSRTRYWRTAFEKQGMQLFTSAAEAPSGSAKRPTRKSSGVQERSAGSASPTSAAGTTAASISDGEQTRFSETTSEQSIDAGEAPEQQREGKKGGQAKYALSPSSTFSEAARLILAKPFADLKKHAKNKNIEADPEIVHRMRVATRKMRSAFLLFDGAFKPRTTRPLVKGLKRLAGYLGRVRDRDVLLMHMHTHMSQLDDDARRAFLPLFEIWQDEHASHMSALRAHLASERFDALLLKLEDFLATRGAGDASEPANAAGIPLRAGTLVPLLVSQRYADIMAFDPFLPTATLDMLHSLRIQCKRMRYALEFFTRLLGPETQALIDRVTAMQDLLGHIQDAQTAGQLIATFVDSLERRQLDVTFTERINPAPLLHYLAARQAEKHIAMASVESEWRELSGPGFRANLLAVLLHVPAS